MKYNTDSMSHKTEGYWKSRKSQLKIAFVTLDLRKFSGFLKDYWISLRRKILQSVDCVSHILRRYLTTAKGQRTNAIYYIPCNECDNEYDNEYIGQIKRQFSTRLKEHQKAVFFRQK